MLWNVIVISVSLSIDALGIGISYRLKGVDITHPAKITIGLVSVLVMWLSLFLGRMIQQVFPTDVAKIIGCSILGLMGLSFIRSALLSQEDATYDFNKSKKIDWWEAIVLGFALSIDSVSAGIAAVTMGLGNCFIPFCVGFMQVIFLYMAEFLIARTKIIKHINKKLCGTCSGILLLIIASVRLLG